MLFQLPRCSRRIRSRSSRLSQPRLGVLSLEPLEQRLALTTLPAGFSETLITTGANLSSPTAMEFSPVDELWVLEQSGNVKLVRSNGTTHTAIDLSVNSSGERGLLGIAFDPTYDGAGPNTDYVYLYYTTSSNVHNRLSRFTVAGAGTNTPTLASESILRDLPPEAEDGDTNHNGGAIHFGNDGKLYVAVGDHNYDPANQNNHPSQLLNTPFGKMLRLNADGTNPTDNPFYDDDPDSWQGAIWALGLRNPYTFAVDRESGAIFINDVGEGAWEEINLGEAGANYGWAGSNGPRWEGFEASPPPWDNYRDPIMAYDHASNTPPTLPAAVAITGGVFYPSGSQFGEDYAGKYFFADVGANFIRVFDPENPGSLAAPDTSTDFASLTNGGAVDLRVDAQGSLYYLARGGTGEVYRITRNDAEVTVTGRHLFYNQSSFDDNDAAANLSDDAAIATDKSAYMPGTGAATFDNISSYTRGLNGIMIDLSVAGTITAADLQFKIGADNAPDTWTAAPAPESVTVRPGGGVGGSDRVVITWGLDAPKNTWLQVTVEGNDAAGGFNSNTGLAASDVFYFGSRIGDVGTGTPTAAQTTAGDEIATRNNTGAGASITNIFDHDRSGAVTGGDSIAARNNTGVMVKINIGGLPEALEAAGVEATGPAASATEGESAAIPLPAWIGSRVAALALRPREIAAWDLVWQSIDRIGEVTDDVDGSGLLDELAARLKLEAKLL